MLKDFEELKQSDYIKAEKILLDFLVDKLPHSTSYKFAKVYNNVNYYFVYDISNKADGIFLSRMIIKAHVYNLKENELLFTEQDFQIFGDLKGKSSAIAFIQIDKNYKPVNLEIINPSEDSLS